ncbi:hypothetical protein CDL15_Pgr015038 [Punica granatum]|uniref:Uncharacterized protein n=1 Tax=Punica granatum TaxID=22663 RepID=A0A218X0G2_PUNGR|nr:hypothetical protein CDL15_Pgr015038 [Punica granatum]PKI43316.1 hypothetical protein CRG98_036296 [Punica granatum]
MGPSLVVVVVVWSQICRVDPYSPAKITENKVRLEIRPGWAIFGSNVTPVSLDGILRLDIFMEEKATCMEKKPRERGGKGQGAAALGQPVGPTVLRGSSGQCLGLD